MNLDPQIAETIVDNLKDVINHEINLFDTTGTIIASTDRARIGTTHEGARLAAETQQPVPIDSEHQFKGARHGINVPVMFQDAAVAVIGITGERAEVEPFGNVIKKMTEILIRENWDHVEQYDRRVRIANLASILKLRHHDESLAAYYASLLQIDLDIPRIVLVGCARAEGDDAPDYNDLYAMLHARFQSFRTSFFAFLERDICMFIDARDEHRLPSLVERISDDAERVLGHPLIFGAGRPAPYGSVYWRSYDEACRALEWLAFKDDDKLIRFEDMDLGLIISSVSQDSALQLVNHAFAGLSEREIEEYQEIFEAYVRHNGSIVHCADELYLHKNTLQNRLNKIAAKTGYNPRDLADHTVLTIAFMLHSYYGKGTNHGDPRTR